MARHWILVPGIGVRIPAWTTATTKISNTSHALIDIPPMLAMLYLYFECCSCTALRSLGTQLRQTLMHSEKRSASLSSFPKTQKNIVP